MRGAAQTFRLRAECVSRRPPPRASDAAVTLNPTVRNLLLTTVIVGLLIAAVGAAVYSTYTSVTSNDGNTFQAGQIELTDNDSGNALFTISGFVPATASHPHPGRLHQHPGRAVAGAPLRHHRRERPRSVPGSAHPPRHAPARNARRRLHRLHRRCHRLQRRRRGRDLRQHAAPSSPTTGPTAPTIPIPPGITARAPPTRSR